MTELELRQTYALALVNWCGAQEGDKLHEAILQHYNRIVPLPRGHRATKKDDWCAITVSGVAVQTGLEAIFPLECSCSKIITQAKAMGIWQERDDYVPRIGDWVIYNWQAEAAGDDTGAPDHIGGVTQVMGNTINVTEGNYGNRVQIRRISVDYRYIRGFVCPDYASLATGQKEEGKIMLEVKELREGDKSGMVKAAQALLNLHLSKSEQLAEDGSFGPATLKGVRKVREKLSLASGDTVDGMLWKKLMGA